MVRKSSTEQSRLERDGPLRVRLTSAPGAEHRLTVTAIDDRAGRFLCIDVEEAHPGETHVVRAIVDAASAKDLAHWLVEVIGARPPQGTLI